MVADEGCIRFLTRMLVLAVWAVIPKIWLSSNQQAASPGAGQPDEKHLDISAAALAGATEIR